MTRNCQYIRIKNIVEKPTKASQTLKLGNAMILIHNALINNIKRSEAAYKVYQQGLTYHQALHVFHANKKIYDELNCTKQ